jgi:hypothetical protein
VTGGVGVAHKSEERETVTKMVDRRRAMEALARELGKLTDNAIMTLAFASTEGLNAEQLRARLGAIQDVIMTKKDADRLAQSYTDGLEELTRLVVERFGEEDDDELSFPDPDADIPEFRPADTMTPEQRAGLHELRKSITPDGAPLSFPPHPGDLPDRDE